MKIRLLLLLAGLAGSGVAPAQAQCVRFASYPYRHHRRAAAGQRPDSSAAKKPHQPSRAGAYVGLMGARDRGGTAYLGGDFEGSYLLAPRWSSGLRLTFTAPARVPARPAGSYEGAGRPQTEVSSLTWSNALLLADRPRWRLGILAGAGLGWASLRDQDQQVPVRGNTRNNRHCGCTESKRLDTSWNPVSEIGLTATYKPQAANAPWLTLRGQYRTWQGAVPFGSPGQFSHYLLSVGLSLPDAPRRGR